jgi:hypothetical protein
MNNSRPHRPAWPNPQGKNGSAMRLTIPLGPRSRKAVKLRRSAPARDSGGFDPSSRVEIFQCIPCN